jgi:DNA (cytosine-5)-methyltransferase 1
MIPVIDLFAGPGGLGEGFSAYRSPAGDPAFRIALSIEKDSVAHATLKLRSFFRQFAQERIPGEYYDHLRGTLRREQLYSQYPEENTNAEAEAWNAELGNYRRFPSPKIDERIHEGLKGCSDWVLIGGPPCQAYSTVGRSRVIPVDRREGTNNYESDKRHFLYRAYLRVLAKHSPPVFVFENVKGILSAEVAGTRIIDRLLSDLRHPSSAARDEDTSKTDGLEYKIYPLGDYPERPGLSDKDFPSDPADYIVRSEEHGIPQARHRLILLGIRSDISIRPKTLRVHRNKVPMWDVIRDLPRLRSRLSNGGDSGSTWVDAIRLLIGSDAILDPAIDDRVVSVIFSKLNQLRQDLPVGGSFLEWNCRPLIQRGWYVDTRLGGVCNHVSRSHMKSDLWRYFFLACYATVHKKSPKLPCFPASLLPKHDNVVQAKGDDIIFKDRFRVQIKGRPATTVTSHIGKDGHYFVHPDAIQCRSLTVREAARLQTFPDNYFFSGPTTNQYQQVGNAVPPLLARQIAAIVYDLVHCAAQTKAG